MYQFWAMGRLEVKGKPATILGKIGEFFKRVLGMWTNDQRAVNIMEYFHSGEYAKDTRPGAVSRVMNEGTFSRDHFSRRLEHLKTMVGPLDTLAARVITTGDSQVRSMGIPSLTRLIDQVYAPLQGASKDPGYLPVARTERTRVLNHLAGELRDFQPAAITDALGSMQRGEKGSTPEERLIIRHVRKTLDGMYEYMEGAGVKMGDLGYGKEYFPRVWDPATVLAKEADFRAMLQTYKDGGKFDGSIDQVLASLTRADGSELMVETAKPGMQFTRERVLGFIRGADAEPFLNKDMYQTLNSYITQGTRRAEWARRFSDDGSVLKQLFEEARVEGATEEQIMTAMKYLKATDGTLGDSLDPQLRHAFGNMIVYQNVRLLPFAIFSSMIEGLPALRLRSNAPLKSAVRSTVSPWPPNARA